jgi:hypothetical protein
LDAETRRLDEDARRLRNWKRFGPYLGERQWGTVREDYSADGSCWSYFPHDHARSRAYRWGEDGLLGLSDRKGRLCFALALWNHRDPILKERLFGLSGPEGNHGEDVKELYFYLDGTPTHSYMRALYKYPQAAFPYAQLVTENARRGKDQPEFELVDTGIFDEGRYFDVFVEYAKASPDDIHVRVRIVNRGPEAAPLTVLPTIWFRNTWAWGRVGEDYGPRPRLRQVAPGVLRAEHRELGAYLFTADPVSGAEAVPLVFTENETNFSRLFGLPAGGFVKDAFHEHVIDGRADAVNPAREGTKAAALYGLTVPAGGEVVLRQRLVSVTEARPHEEPSAHADEIFAARRAEADAFYQLRNPGLSRDEALVVRQGYAGLLWSKQFYHYDVRTWLEGDPSQPPPPAGRAQGRNAGWTHLYNRDVISMPDKWEYPWFAAWDLGFHTVPFAHIDPVFAKEQLVLLLREWYMHPSGQLPAYEFAFSDVNPPVHAWAAWRVYKLACDAHGKRDRLFLSRVFQKLLLNFTWWVNRKDAQGRNLFAGGFLGLDNIGVFDRSQALPTGGQLEQADGTAWMAFYSATMLSMALELARGDEAYDDMASKFFEHFVAISEAMNEFGGSGLWDAKDGFYYDQLELNGQTVPLKVRSLVGLLPLIAVEVLDEQHIAKLPAFKKRMEWFLANRPDLADRVLMGDGYGHGHVLLALPTKERLVQMLRYMLDENEFLSPYGIRSLSKVHEAHPYSFWHGGCEFRVAYAPGESTSSFFGGNSNWRGPVWLPVNYLIIEALERYHHFFGDALKVECPTGSGRYFTLGHVAHEIARRLARLFLRDEDGVRPSHGRDSGPGDGPGQEPRQEVQDRALWLSRDPACADLVLFYEFFHGDTGRGAGASHQTGWTALIVRLIEKLARHRTRHTRGAAVDPGEIPELR